VLGIIGGSGIYDLEGLRNTQWQRVRSAFGRPSDEILFGELDGQPLCFLPRHGRGHRIPPSRINFRANIDALKRVGVTDLLSLSAVGSLRDDLSPGTLVIVDQFIDQTRSRKRSFFGRGFVAHVSLAEPVCSRLGEALVAAAAGLELGLHRGGTYLVIEGPQFSTRAESHLFRDWKCDVIGMTNLPEARLAREAEICYATVAMVTDYDCWHDTHADVVATDVVAVLRANADRASALLRAVAPHLREHPDRCAAGCDHALDSAVLTPLEARDAKVVARLDAVARRILPAVAPEDQE
jgi:5'-methylthioadenosine phosphorylase